MSVDMVNVLVEDMKYIYKGLSAEEKAKISNSTILLTGCAGFLGFYFLNFFTYFSKELKIKKIIGLDNFILRQPIWIKDLATKYPQLTICHFDIITNDLGTIKDIEHVKYVIHMASIASPAYYRKYPIHTLDANVWGLRKLMDYYVDRKLKGFLFFSSSEVYGDPDTEHIPTDEEYRGYVAMIGPRACYDEAKRFGETLCYYFSLTHKMPITVVRPFNNYGPGMNLNDKRVPADFAKAVFQHHDIEIFSDGTPTRTFCYVADALIGYLKSLVFGKYNYFNIGIDTPEISVKEFAEICVKEGNKIFGYQGSIKFIKVNDEAYLTHNPNRRCPIISKAKELLGYTPSIEVHDGVNRFFKFIKEYGDIL